MTLKIPTTPGSPSVVKPNAPTAAFVAVENTNPVEATANTFMVVPAPVTIISIVAANKGVVGNAHVSTPAVVVSDTLVPAHTSPSKIWQVLVSDEGELRVMYAWAILLIAPDRKVVPPTNVI